MTMNYKPTPQTKELFILGVRILFFIVFMNYGIGKLSGGQFGNLTAHELNTPIKDLSLFKIGWYLFDHQPFKLFIGISQIIAACLLLFNRTFLIGFLILTPIIVNILIIDLTIMPYGFKVSFFFRLSFYLLYIAFIFYCYRKSLIPAYHSLIEKRDFRTKISNKWYYFYLLLIIPFLEIFSGSFKMLYMIIRHFELYWEKFKDYF